LEEVNNERSDDFRRIQEESFAMSDGESQRYRNGSKKISDDLFGRLSRIYREEIHASRSGNGNRYGVLSNTIEDDSKKATFAKYINVTKRIFIQYFVGVKSSW